MRYAVTSEVKLHIDLTRESLEAAGALDRFADEIYEDMDFEWLYDDSKNGTDEDPALDAMGITPLSFSGWFTPFNEDRYVHPYAADEEADLEKRP
ncbi:hypothetical protein ABZ318_18885 [Streptomyces sp. NPDC006197]|uniref:hypothetical protein n=1 Tax=Streptomyces sp. NPDC006197 TaxID=3156685 RepID=UPI0033A843A7